jgi:hypothetical protein
MSSLFSTQFGLTAAEKAPIDSRLGRIATAGSMHQYRKSLFSDLHGDPLPGRPCPQPRVEANRLTAFFHERGHLIFSRTAFETAAIPRIVPRRDWMRERWFPAIDTCSWLDEVSEI